MLVWKLSINKHICCTTLICSNAHIELITFGLHKLCMFSFTSNNNPLTVVLLAVSSAALHRHQSLADGALPCRPVLSGHHEVHQGGGHHLQGVGAVAWQRGHGEVGGASDLQHLRQTDLLQEKPERCSEMKYMMFCVYLKHCS